MLFKYLRILSLSLLFVSIFSCNNSEVPEDPANPTDTTGNGGGGGGGTTETGINTNPDFSFYFKGTKIEFSKIQADFGGKTYLTGFDKSPKFVLDMTIPVAKGVLASNKPFSIENDPNTGMGFFIDNNDKKWFFDEGTITVSKNTGNTISGTFSGKAVYLDFDNPSKPVRSDSTSITNGVFNNLKVKG